MGKFFHQRVPDRPVIVASSGPPTLAFNVANSGNVTAAPHTTQPTLGVPAVRVGDIMVVAISVFTFTPTTPDFTITATSGHAWTNIGGGVQNSGPNGGTNEFGKAWARTATAGDLGDTLTFAFTGTPGSTDQFWWAIGIVSYTPSSGVGTIDIAGGTAAIAAPISPPSESTVLAGDWALAIGCVAVNGSGSITAGPTGAATVRINTGTAGIDLMMSDSNGSVGGAGTGIGGNPFTTSLGPVGWAGFTVGLAA